MKRGLMTAAAGVLCWVTAAAQHEAHGQAPPVMKAVAIMSPAAGKGVRGAILFVQENRGVRVTAHLEGLTPGKHGFHIHEFGDCSASDFLSAGGHFNPTQQVHAGPADAQRHSGDLGNLIADSAGVARLEWLDPVLQLTGPHSILGRGVIVHTKEDDLATQPTGNAGGREACGVIGIAKP